MGDRATHVTETIFCGACLLAFREVLADYKPSELLVFGRKDQVTGFAWYNKDSAPDYLVHAAEAVRDELRRKLCHEQRFVMLNEYRSDPPALFVCTPYTAQEIAELDAEIERNAKIRREAEEQRAAYLDAKCREYGIGKYAKVAEVMGADGQATGQGPQAAADA